MNSFRRDDHREGEGHAQLRKELQEVKKLARERAKAITLRIPQLKDCKNHFDRKKENGKGTMVFICEGQFAACSITSCHECLRTATKQSGRVRAQGQAAQRLGT